MPWHGGRPFSIEAPDARGRAASRSDYELKRFAVLDRFAESVLAESQLQDAPERIDDGHRGHRTPALVTAQLGAVETVADVGLRALIA
jgi:hypothetical protein